MLCGKAYNFSYVVNSALPLNNGEFSGLCSLFSSHSFVCPLYIGSMIANPILEDLWLPGTKSVKKNLV